MAYLPDEGNSEVGGLDEAAVQALIAAALENYDTRPYKVYRALINQNGTNSPAVVTVYENTLDEAVNFSYGDVGVYQADSDAFTENMEAFFLHAENPSAIPLVNVYAEEGTVRIYAFKISEYFSPSDSKTYLMRPIEADNQLGGVIEIRVYD